MKRKMKRYAEGDLVDDESPEAQEVDRKSYATGVRMSEDYTKTPKKTAAKSSASRKVEVKEPKADYGREGRHSKVEDTRGTMKRTPSSMGFRREPPSAEQKDQNAKNFGAEAALSVGPFALLKYAKRAHEVAKASRELGRAQEAMHGSTKAAREFAEAGGMKKGGKVSSASKRADGIAQRGKTKGRLI